MTSDAPQFEPTINSHVSDLEKGSKEQDDVSGVGRVRKVTVDLLEVGDVVRVPKGSTPPADGHIVSKMGSSFDESSLTGESRPIMKNPGDKVFVGTINKGAAVDVSTLR